MRSIVAVAVVPFLCSLSLALAAPKKAAPKGAPAAKAPAELAAVDLAPASFKATIQAPKGATVKEEFGAAKVVLGETFQMEIYEGATDMDGRKKEIAENDINKLKKYHTETAAALLYESAVMGPEFHFVANVKAGETTYHCEDTKGPTYTKADVEVMLKACQSLAAK